MVTVGADMVDPEDSWTAFCSVSRSFLLQPVVAKKIPSVGIFCLQLGAKIPHKNSRLEPENGHPL